MYKVEYWSIIFNTYVTETFDNLEDAVEFAEQFDGTIYLNK